MPEDKRKINAWIPVSLYDKIEPAGYENTTQAIITALQRLLEDPQEDIEGYKQDIEGYLQDIAVITAENSQLKGQLQDTEGSRKDLERIQKDIEKQNQDISGYKQDIKALNDEIAKLKEDLVKAPDLVEFFQLRARYEEQEKHTETLKKELERSGQREEDLKITYNNYFVQVQSLINQKAIEAPGNKKQWWKFW